MNTLPANVTVLQLQPSTTAPGSENDPVVQDEVKAPASILAGKCALIVEDEFFVAIQIEEALHSFGCNTIGPFTTVDLAVQAARRERFDFAILDINLNGKMVYPLADELSRRSIPFLFVTGYSGKDLPEPYRSLPRLQKPFDRNAVKHELEMLLGQGNLN